MRGLTVCATGSTFRLGRRLYLNQKQMPDALPNSHGIHVVSLSKRR